MSGRTTATKIVLIGPEKCGKSSIANFLANEKGKLKDTKDIEYQPTTGVRVLEFETGRDRGSAASKTQTRSVELWDCSGNQKYETCWPAILNDVDAVVLVFNPDNHAHLNEIALWYDEFVSKANVPVSRCVVFAHHMKSAVGSQMQLRVPHAMSRCTLVETDWESDDRVRSSFFRFANAAAN